MSAAPREARQCEVLTWKTQLLLSGQGRLLFVVLGIDIRASANARHSASEVPYPREDPSSKREFKPAPQEGKRERSQEEELFSQLRDQKVGRNLGWQRTEGR